MKVRHIAVITLLALLVLPVGALVFFILPPLVVTTDEVPKASDRLKLQNDVRTTGTQLLAGAVLALGAVFTARTIQVSREGQITERFTRATDQLGSEKVAVRLGGIYALERIAKNSKVDHPSVMEVLTAYVRENAPWPPKQSDDNAPRTPDVDQRDVDNNGPRKVRPKPPPTDIQAVMTVIGRRRAAYDRGDLDLVRTDLRGINLYRADLREASLFDARFDNSVLSDARLNGAGLYNVIFDGALLIGTKFRRALLQGADLAKAKEVYLASLSGAEADYLTRWPPGFDALAAGVHGPLTRE